MFCFRHGDQGFAIPSTRFASGIKTRNAFHQTLPLGIGEHTLQRAGGVRAAQGPGGRAAGTGKLPEPGSKEGAPSLFRQATDRGLASPWPRPEEAICSIGNSLPASFPFCCVPPQVAQEAPRCVLALDKSPSLNLPPSPLQTQETTQDPPGPHVSPSDLLLL